VTQKIAMCVAYDGTCYRGWQKQASSESIQAFIETALTRMAKHPVVVHCAGRTDAGVHASKQVIHFETVTQRDAHEWTHGTNFYLPRDVRILYAQSVDTHFHARFSAISRIYHYIIDIQNVFSVFLKNKVMHSSYSFDLEAMQVAAQYLLGEHDFSAFRGRDCQAKTPVRTVYDISVRQNANIVIIRCHANAFLHHMVRNIVGSLLEVGRKKKAPDWVSTVLSSRDRRCAGPMAVASGLYLTDVIYPSPYIFPPMPFLWK